jgi:hypothetical protein
MSYFSRVLLPPPGVPDALPQDLLMTTTGSTLTPLSASDLVRLGLTGLSMDGAAFEVANLRAADTLVGRGWRLIASNPNAVG